MHNLQLTTDTLRVITGSAADLDCEVSHIDMTQASPPVPDWPITTFTNIPSAATTTVAAAPAASKTRKIKAVSITNVHASQSTTVRVVIERSGPVTWDCFNMITLQPGESLTFTEATGWFYNKGTISVPVGTTNFLTGADQTLATADIYLSNSVLKLDGMGAPTVGRGFHWEFILSKTAGTAAGVLTVRIGTTASTTDSGKAVFTWAVGTSVADRAEFEIDARFTAVGAGTSSVLRAKGNMTNNLASTGFNGTIAALQPADSAGFDSTAAGLQIGLSWNGSTVFAGLLEYMKAYTDQL